MFIETRDPWSTLEFIGKNGVSAPLIRDAPLRNPKRVYKQLLNYLGRLYRKGGLVHADLSEYNIMILRGKPVIFDVSQAVPIKHPMADQFLRRDLENLYRYFKKLDVAVLSVEEMYKRVTRGRG
jgi:RIO kinase 1